ncbi:MAG: hypothetical protein WD988_01450 [Candidatus Curtissbacteria bacterium]
MAIHELSRREFLRFGRDGAAVGAFAALAGIRFPECEKSREVRLFTSMVQSSDAIYLVSERNELTTDESGLSWRHRLDNKSSILSMREGENPRLVTEVSNLRSNLAPKADGGVVFASENKILALDPSGRITQLYELPNEIINVDKGIEGVAVSKDNKIAYVYDGKLYLVESDGVSRRLNPDRSVLDLPVWSPDGSKIAYVSYEDKNWHIEIINSDGTGMQKIGVGGSEAPAWSPDSRNLAFIGRPGGLRGLHVQFGDGRVVSGLSSRNHIFPRNPVWSPDGSLIAYTANEGLPDPKGGSGEIIGRGYVFTVDPRTGEAPKKRSPGAAELVWLADGIASIRNDEKGSSVHIEGYLYGFIQK